MIGQVRGIVKGDGESPFTYNPCKKETFSEVSFFALKLLTA